MGSLGTDKQGDSGLMAYPIKGTRPVPQSKIDRRSDAEIVDSLLQHRPVTTEKNVWAYWHSGISNMPAWTRRNVVNWVRKLGPGWEVRVLDRVEGSPNNVSQFVDSTHFPKAFNENTMTGQNFGQHSADILRLPLLYLYGGVWMDVGMILLRHLDSMCWDAIEDPNSPCEIAAFRAYLRPDVPSIVNGFIAAKKDNPFIKRWHAIFLEIYKDRTNNSGIHAHPLVRHLPQLAPPLTEVNSPTFDAESAVFSDYLGHFLACDRLIHLDDPTPSDSFNGAKYFEEHFLLFELMQEMYLLQLNSAWNGTKEHQLLSAPVDKSTAPDAELRDEAEALVNNILANSCTMKLSHGFQGSGVDFLADIWEKPEHKDADCKEGTFAGYLRAGSVLLEQTREVETLEKQVVKPETVVRAGLLEPIIDN